MRHCVERAAGTPFGLSLSKPCVPIILSLSKPFDKLRANGSFTTPVRAEPVEAKRRPFDKLRANGLGMVVVAMALAAATVSSQAAVPALDEREALRAGEAAIGRAVPDLTLQDREGRPVRLADYRGKPLLVSFIYTGCRRKRARCTKP
jgi:AhpC/TSA family